MMTTPRPLLGLIPPFFVLLIVIFIIPAMPSPTQQFDTAGQKVTFYPASLIITHHARPLIFYSDTKLINVATQLRLLSPSPVPTFQTHCSPIQTQFLQQIINSVQQIQRMARRLLSLPGFSDLIECDVYLRRYYQYSAGLPARMICPHGYKTSLSECKKWALTHCTNFSPDEKLWLRNPPRNRRSNWMCHAGVFGLFRKIYESTGHQCEPNHFMGFVTTLSQITATMSTFQNLVHTINGKTVYLVKTTDSMHSKINRLSLDLNNIDVTLSRWKTQLNNLTNTEACHNNLNMEFLSQYAAAVNRALASILRLIEVQDTLTEISHFSNKKLVGYSDMPHFLSNAITTAIASDSSMKYTVKALEQGFSAILNPLTNFEHNGKTLNLSVLLTIPEITDLNAFCTLEYLSPIRFNLSHTCYTGPFTQTNLALITCPHTKRLINVDALAKCFHDDNTFLCSKTLLNTVNEVTWLGFPWNPTRPLTFPRHHVPAQDCSNLHPLLHLGGRYYLSTTTQTFATSKGPLQLSPLMIYHFPCNTTFPDMVTGLGTCPQRMTLTVPVFSRDTLTYTPWTPTDDDTLLRLHYKSLPIPPPDTLNKTVLKELDNTYQTLDARLTLQLAKANDSIASLHETTDTPISAILAALALSLSLLNTLVLLVTIIIPTLRRKLHTKTIHTPQRQPSSPTCPDCHLPLQDATASLVTPTLQ